MTVKLRRAGCMTETRKQYQHARSDILQQMSTHCQRPACRKPA
jgi:hypothetical protein